MNPTDLIGQRAPWDLRLTPLVDATPARFKSSRAPFERLWSGPCLVRGRPLCSIHSAPLDAGTAIERASAFCQRLALTRGIAPPPFWDRASLEAVGWLHGADADGRSGGEDALHDWSGASIGRVLWNLGGFGSLRWDWDLLTPGEEPSPGPSGRVDAALPWDHGRPAVAALRAAVAAQLRELPRPPASISRRRFEVVVTADLDSVEALCGKAGVVAHGLLDAPYAVVERSLTLRSSARETLVCIETATDWFGVYSMES